MVDCRKDYLHNDDGFWCKMINVQLKKIYLKRGGIGAFSVCVLIASWIYYATLIFDSNLRLFASIIYLFSSLAIFINSAKSSRRDEGPILLLGVAFITFAWARIVLGAIERDIFDLSYFELQTGYSLSMHEVQVYFDAMIATIICYATYLLASVWAKVDNYSDYKVRIIGDARVKYFGIIFCIGAIFSIIQALFYFRFYASGGGYNESYLKGGYDIAFPGASFLAGLLFIGFVGICLFGANARTGKFYLFTFVLLTLLQLVKGSRGEVFTQLLVGIWFFYRSQNRSLPKVTLLLGGVFLVALAEAVSYIRVGQDLNFAGVGVWDKAKWFFYTQGVSGEIVGVSAEKLKVGLDATVYFLAPLLSAGYLFSGALSGGMSLLEASNSGIFSHELSAFLFPLGYMQGQGIGSSYIAEAHHVIGIPGIVVSTAMLLTFVDGGNRLCKLSPYFYGAYICALPYMLFVPRETLFYFVAPLIKAFFIFTLARFFYGRRSHGGYSHI